MYNMFYTVLTHTVQKTFRYQAKCLQWIRDEFNALNDNDKQRVMSALSETGCEDVLSD